jgi:hypothetical protein
MPLVPYDGWIEDVPPSYLCFSQKSVAIDIHRDLEGQPKFEFQREY